MLITMLFYQGINDKNYAQNISCASNSPFKVHQIKLNFISYTYTLIEKNAGEGVFS